jgi:hypothetical protein
MDACLKVKARGYQVLFDFGNVLDHFPTNPAFSGGRDGDLQVKLYNPAYNAAFVLSWHTRGLLRAVRLSCLFLVGSVDNPGLLANLVARRRYGQIGRQVRILFRTWAPVLSGWSAGSRRVPY